MKVDMSTTEPPLVVPWEAYRRWLQDGDHDAAATLDDWESKLAAANTVLESTAHNPESTKDHAVQIIQYHLENWASPGQWRLANGEARTLAEALAAAGLLLGEQEETE